MTRSALSRVLACTSLFALVGCNAILGNKDRPLAIEGAGGSVDAAGASGSSHSGSAGKASSSGASSGGSGGEIDDSAGEGAGAAAGMPQGDAGADTGGSSTAGSGGTINSAGSAGSGTGGSSTAGSGGTISSAGSAGKGSAGGGGTGGSGGKGSAGSGGGGTAGSSGSGGTGGATVTLPPLVTSAVGAYWKTDGTLTDSTATPTVTVNDTVPGQKWDGFGATFNELGWTVLPTPSMKTQALKLLFSATDGAAFTWGRIPMGANDYASIRYTADDTGTDVTPSVNEANRPAPDLALASFNLTQDGINLIPYIKAAQAAKPDLRFWASPWTPPVWMKTGYKTKSSDANSAAPVPSYYDGGSMKSDAATLTAYANYFTKFVIGYRGQGINIEIVSPQSEPGYDLNYPSCLWDKTTYTSFVGQYLGPAMKAINVQVMLGTLSNNGDNAKTDLDISTAVQADATAKTFVSLVGVQWAVLDKVNTGTTFGSLPIWATEHKGGNYPWLAGYNAAQAPNDHPYGVESWGYIRDAISKGKVTSYDAWNLVLDKTGKSIDTSRDWKQDALLVADSGLVTPTAAYYVFRHLSQYAAPGATVVGTTGGDAVAFKNPDGSLVAVMFNSGAANSAYVIAIGGKKFQFAMPANGWATVKYKP